MKTTGPVAGDATRTFAWPAILTVVLLFAPLYLQGLGATDIVGDDEAREVGIVQDIIQRGRWILPRFNESTLPDKPLLYHWIGAVSCVAAGECTEGALRLPSALSALLLIAVVGLAATRLFDPATGISAALLLGLSPFLFARARLARPDVLLTLLLTAALFTFFTWWQDGGRSDRRATAFGTLLGLAVLAKGPVAPIVAAVTIGGFLGIRGELRRGSRLLAPHVMLPLCILGGSWYVLALGRGGQAFARHHLLGRYVGNVLGGDFALGVSPSHSLVHHVTFYPLHLLLGTLPWTPLLIAAWVAIWLDAKKRTDPRLQFIQTWIVATVLVFSCAAFKLRHYVLPALPAAAVLMAPFAATLARQRGEAANRTGIPHERALALSALGIGLTAIAMAAWWQIGGPAALSRSDRLLADALAVAARGQPVSAAFAGAAAALLCGAALYAALRRQWRRLLGLGVVGVLAWMLVLQPTISAALAERSSLKPFVAVVRRTVPGTAPLYFFGSVLRPVVVYLNRPLLSLRRDLSRARGSPAYLIVTEADLPRLLEVTPDARTLAEHVGRVGNLARGRVLLVEVVIP